MARESTGGQEFFTLCGRKLQRRAIKSLSYGHAGGGQTSGGNMDTPKLKVVQVATDDLVPYANNAKLHDATQIDQIAESIKQFGFNDPVGVWTNADGQLEIVEGHGRVLAAKKLGIERLPVINLDHMDDEARRAYTHVHNQLTMNTPFDMDALDAEIKRLNEFDWQSLGFKSLDWFSNREAWDDSRQDGNEEYNAFLAKFEQEKTTDDCYTPNNIYEAVAEWVSERYDIARADMVRPFYPGGDYENENYKPNACVVDNPPFSILAQIIRFYNECGIKFFLFAPGLTLFSSSSSSSCSIPQCVNITYENGASVATSFVTNMEEARIHTYPDLYKRIEEANDINLAEMHADLPKYEYPDYVLTPNRAGWLCKYGQELEIMPNECVRISALDEQKEQGKVIYGSGYLLSEKAAAEKAAAEKAAACKWQLSEREFDIVASLG